MSALSQIAKNGSGIPYSPEFLTESLANVPVTDRKEQSVTKKIAAVGSVALIGIATYNFISMLFKSAEDASNTAVEVTNARVMEQRATNEEDRERFSIARAAAEERANLTAVHLQTITNEYVRLFGVQPPTNLEVLSINEMRQLSLAEHETEQHMDYPLWDLFRRKYQTLHRG
jgi:hypothetical protein